MESLKNAVGSAFNKVFGGQPETDQKNVHDTVQKVISRLEISTLLEDRRNACKTLRALSADYRQEVGSLAMDVLIQTLKNDKEDRDIVNDVLTALNLIISGNAFEPGASSDADDETLNIAFTEMFIKKKENIQLIFDIIKDKDYMESRFRPTALKIFSEITRNKPKEIQEFILSTPMGVTTLVDLLSDFGDFIRLDGITLLTHLAKNNATVQETAACTNAFYSILAIIKAEEYAAGGVIVKDCLLLLQNLLKNNDRTQNLFKEEDHIQHLNPLLDIIFDTDLTSEKVLDIKNNVLLTLQVIRILVSPKNPQKVRNSCQYSMKSSGILHQLCKIIFFQGSPPDIVTEVLNTIAEIIRGNHQNQAFFRKVSDDDSSTPILLRLLESMINSKNPLDLRSAALYCFQSFLYQNEVGQAHVIDTLLGSQVLDATMCELICKSLLSNKPLSNWFASTALCHAIIDNKTQKQQLLSVHLAIENQQNPISLLRLCCSRVQDCSKYQTRIGLLMLLSQWLVDCPNAVSEFLQINTNIPFLISEVASMKGDESEQVIQGLYAFLIGICIKFNDGSVHSYTQENLLEIILRRVGVEMFSQKLAIILQSEGFSIADRKPQIKAVDENQLMFDYEFCKLYRSLEQSIIKVIQNEPANSPESMSAEQHKLLIQYRELIRRQDDDISSMKNELEILRGENHKLSEDYKELFSKYQLVSDQNALLRAQNSANIPSHPSSIVAGGNNNDETSSQVSSLEAPPRFGSMESTIPEYKIPIMNEYDEERIGMIEKIQSLEMQLSRAQIENSFSIAEKDNLQNRVCELENTIKVQESRNSDLESFIKVLRSQLNELDAVVKNQHCKLSEYEQHFQQIYQQKYSEQKPLENHLDVTRSAIQGPPLQQLPSQIPPSYMNHNPNGLQEL